MARVFCKEAVLIARPWCFPLFPPRCKFLCRKVEFNEALVPVEGDQITVSHQSDGPANKGFGRNMANDPAPGPSGEATVGDERDRVEQSLPDERCGWR